MAGEVGTTHEFESTSNQLQRIGMKAKERAIAEIDHRRGDLAGRLGELAGKIESLGREQEGLERQVFSRAASYLHEVASRLDGKSADELVKDVSRQMRRRPGLVFAGVAMLGFLGGRLARR
jgi:hypothetical protein